MPRRRKNRGESAHDYQINKAMSNDMSWVPQLAQPPPRRTHTGAAGYLVERHSTISTAPHHYQGESAQDNQINMAMSHDMSWVPQLAQPPPRRTHPGAGAGYLGERQATTSTAAPRQHYQGESAHDSYLDMAVSHDIRWVPQLAQQPPRLTHPGAGAGYLGERQATISTAAPRQQYQGESAHDSYSDMAVSHDNSWVPQLAQPPPRRTYAEAGGYPVKRKSTSSTAPQQYQGRSAQDYPINMTMSHNMSWVPQLAKPPPRSTHSIAGGYLVG